MMLIRRRLSWCPECKEFSVHHKKYKGKDGLIRKVDYCVNKGCGYRKDRYAQRGRFGPDLIFGGA